MFQLKMLFVFLLTTVLTFNVYAQEHYPAMAVPMSDIAVDGNLDDWQEGLQSYPIGYIYQEGEATDADFKPSFRVAYNLELQCLYLGIEVVDDEHVVMEGEEDYSLLDCVILYLDKGHDANGGSNVLFTVGEKYRDVFKRAKEWAPLNADLSWEKVEVAVRRMEGRTVYEWKINLGDALEIGKPIGMDFLVVDADPNQAEAASAVWTNGFGKSRGSLHLGEVVPVAKKAKFGWLKGSVSVKDSAINWASNAVKITSLSHPDLWVQTPIDSLGQYQAYLPAGKYEMSPLLNITSEWYSDAFNQNSRRITAEKRVVAKVKKSKTARAELLEWATLPLPEGLFEEEGILLKEGDVDEQKINHFVETYQEYFGIPGVSIALIKDGKLVYDRVWGSKNLVTNEPLGKSTLFEAASITKSVFAVMVLKLAEKGVIDLDKPLYEYLAFPNIEKDERSKLMTGRMVLNHQSGLPNWAFGGKFGGPGGWKSGKEIRLDFAPGTDFFYSGEGMNYLGRVVEKLTGKSLTELFEAEIVPNFGLKNSYFTYHHESMKDRIALGHFHRFPFYKDKVDMDSPASSLMTEASDFSRFVMGLMDEAYLSKASYESIYTPESILEPSEKLYDPDLPQGVAHGFFVQETPQGKVLGHGGNNGDFDCKYAYIPEKKVGYVVFTNSNLGDEFIRLLELYVFRGSVGL